MLPRFCIRWRIKYLVVSFLTIFVVDFLGGFTHLFEKNFDTDFEQSYPLTGDVRKFAYQQRHGQKPDHPIINTYNYTFLEPSKHKCITDDGTLLAPRLVFIIKSATNNFKRRSAIRNSWGFERRLSDVMIRTVFLLGIIPPHTKGADKLQELLDMEMEQFQDIVQANFYDTYYNNTIKTMMGIKWAIKFCSRSKFYMFVDDDFYVSTKNVLRFVRNPVNYPEYLEEADETLRKLARRLSQSDQLSNYSTVDIEEVKRIASLNSVHHTINNRGHINKINTFLDNQERKALQNRKETLHNRQLKFSRHLLEMELADDVKLFSGFVFSSAPHRHKSSKWYVSLEEYSWHMWPSYVTAGAFILSREALIEFYYVSMFTKHFR